MRTSIALGFAATLVALLPTQASAQISEAEAKSMGLEVAWRAHVQMPRFGRGIASASIWVEPRNPREFGVAQVGERTFRISAGQLDKKGAPIGVDAAVEQAMQMATRFQGKADGIQTQKLSVPLVRLVIVTEDGLVQLYDAETGMLLWANACGHSDAPAFPPALSPAGISVIHGNELYVLDWETGKQIVVRRLRSNTANAIGVANGVAFVSDFIGNITTYGIGDPIRPWSYVIQGRAVGQPVSLSDLSFCAIASEDGFAYVFTNEKEPSVWLRYEASSAIAGSLAAGNKAFYVGTIGGSIAKFSVEQRLGSIEWEHRTGAAITTPILVSNQAVYVATEAGMLLSLADDKAGTVNWFDQSNGIEYVIGTYGDRVMCLAKSGSLVALDAATGRLIGRTMPGNFTKPIVNSKTDRVYVISNQGKLICLRPVGSDLPSFITPVEAAPENNQATEQPTTTEPATGGNIFGASPAASSPAADIFGQGDPFAPNAGGNAADENNANPFDTGNGGNVFDF